MISDQKDMFIRGNVSEEDGVDLFTQFIPRDVHLHILSFLDVSSLIPSFQLLLLFIQLTYLVYRTFGDVGERYLPIRTGI